MIDGYDTNSLIVSFMFFGGVTVVGILRAVLYPSQKALDSWMIGHGLRKGAQTRPRVAAYLRRTRWIRTIGFLAGWNVPFVWMWVTRSAYRMDDLGTYWWLIGFAAGIILAEVTRPHASGGSVTVEPRELRQYLPGFTRIDNCILAGLALLMAGAGSILPLGTIRLPGEHVPTRHDTIWYVGLALAALSIIAATRIAQEFVVRRRQSFDDLDDLQADDAMRSASIQGLAGLGYGGPMWLVAAMAWDLARTTNSPIAWVFGVLGILLLFGGLGMLLGFPRLNTKWIVPRAREA
ncbi:MAG: hypothetical protein WBV06_06385 [Acidimicrobiia bacterium]